MYVTVYTRNRAAEKAAALEAKKAAPKKRGRPRKQRTEKWFAHIADTLTRMVTQSVAKAVASR